jgi:predicted porin
MKKSLFSLAAICAFSGAANAQSSLTLYGVVDSALEYVNEMARGAPTVVNGQLVPQTGGSRFSIPFTGGLSSSRWGMRGSEDLGGGLRAMFVLESGFGLDDGRSQQGGRLFGRQAFVGLENQYGKLTLGRQQNALFEGLANFSPTHYSLLYEPNIFLVGLDYRVDNAIKYTGQFGPVTATAHYSFGTGVPIVGLTPLPDAGAGETPGHFRDNADWAVALNYFAGHFGAALVYDEWSPAVTAGQPGKSRKAGTALSYTMGPFKVMGGYRWQKIDFNNGNTLVRDDYWWAGANYQVTPALELTLGYAYADIRQTALGATAPPTNPANPWQVNFMADYNLSKRTDIYATTAYVRNAGLNFDTSAVGFGQGYFPTPGQKGMFGLALGVRHKF